MSRLLMNDKSWPEPDAGSVLAFRRHDDNSQSARQKVSKLSWHGHRLQDAMFACSCIVGDPCLFSLCPARGFLSLNHRSHRPLAVFKLH
jgi:hypothetical protein